MIYVCINVAIIYQKTSIVLDKDVKSDKLRMSEAEDGTVGVVAVAVEDAPAAPAVVENTG